MDEDYFDSVTSIVKLVDPWVAIAGGDGSTITSHLGMKTYLGNDEPSRYRMHDCLILMFLQIFTWVSPNLVSPSFI